jgi:hypothetical protein
MTNVWNGCIKYIRETSERNAENLRRYAIYMYFWNLGEPTEMFDNNVSEIMIEDNQFSTDIGDAWILKVDCEPLSTPYKRGMFLKISC